MVAFLVGGNAVGYDWASPATWSMVVLPILIWGRSVFFGIYVSGDRLKIVSWFWTYRLQASRISKVSVANYNGYVTMWSGGGGLYSTSVSMIGFEFDSGRERYFPATAMRVSRARTAGEALRRRLGLPPLADAVSFRRLARGETDQGSGRA
ncbi:hypothetical protein [Agromyces luteolus]|uniref:Uncharacterized protein n=1 Tax=Agromyces luteolus TaxID=88373 RepID=A0A7C9LDJ0_9MICO|nr:hypothetical protein [Agromyces luteolus]MUN06010.1 hypothetical protein [Agromyces luteolus]